ncbi:hypothetical protein [Krasilnikovia cinnamomea]|uniref:hypothetical protein n=1 Tax=Krasilnikovia cinnamomea TaxID=349313 RepID=UPI00102BA153|nr:hypothetical protein [Krasilnikovia cinnamomea]
MRKTVLITFTMGLAIALSWTSPASAADTAPQVKRHAITSKLTESSLKTFGMLQLRNLKTSQHVTPFAAPPGGGCRYPVSFNGFAQYTNGTLSAVNLDYQAQVVCTATGPNQSMGAIVDTAQLWKNTTMLGEAPTVNCVDCLVSPVSMDFYACGGVTCAGNYWASNLYGLKAPSGYAWPTPPAGCIGQGQQPPYEWILCTVVTDTVTVPPTA